MSEPRTGEKLVRPRQVTLAGWMIVIGSVGVVLTVFSQVSSLNSLTTTRALEEALSRPPASGLGVDVAEAREALRISAMVAGACAAAAAILGWQVLQRSKQARVGLAVLALPLFVTGVASGGLLSSVVVASAVMLWLQPARDWFAGRTPVVAPRAPRAPQVPRANQPGPPPGSPQGAPPQGAPPQGAPQQQVWQQPPPATGAPVVPLDQLPREPLRHVGSAHPAAGGEAPPRPAQLVWACVLTWVGAGLVAAILGLSVLVLVAAPDSLLDEVARQNPELADEGIRLQDVRVTAAVAAAVVIAWCVAAAVLAVLVFRGRGWAHVGLVVSASLAALLCLLGVLLNPLLVVPLVACTATVALLLRAEVRWWVRANARGRAT